MEEKIMNNKWKTDSTEFAKMLINGLQEDYASEKEDLVKKIKRLIDIHYNERLLIDLELKSK
jgi:hypothetical protein